MTTAQPVPGTIVWRDLTVPDAERVRDFYREVVGWTSNAVEMGEYQDFTMHSADGMCIAGVCHALGSNAKVPPQWLIYVAVGDVVEAARRCIELGGKVIDGPRPMSGQMFCVIQDPAGAVVALIG